jgi:aspartate/methionine/tyrosine aminotransferase
MKINPSKVTFSSIVGIGQKVTKAEKETGEEYLHLNRGVNAVTNIDLTEVVKNIDPNTKEYQVYAPNMGMEKLRRSIIGEYFPSQNTDEFKNVTIMPGGMPGLDLIIQTLNVDNIIFPKFYWGSYSKMATIRGKSFSFYDDLSDLTSEQLNHNTCVFICDPNNPTGIKLHDEELYHQIHRLNTYGVTVIFDSPYRKLFNLFEGQIDLFDWIGNMDNVIVCESFSKSLGISGARLGFVWCNNKEFNAELNIRILYEFNGVCSISQLLVNELLTTNVGKAAVNDFKRKTTLDIFNNIDYLYDNGLLVKEIYGDNKPKGMFAIINMNEDFLFKNKIGAVGLDKFVHHDKDMYSSYSRICVSVPHDKFVKFFNNIIKIGVDSEC